MEFFFYFVFLEFLKTGATVDVSVGASDGALENVGPAVVGGSVGAFEGG